MFPMHGGFMGRKKGGLPYTPPLDAANAKVAYSVRKLRTDYTGFCLQVTNIAAGITADVGFDTNGYIDLAQLSAAVLSDDATITRWYDQTGNGYDMQQASVPLRPIIATSGIIYLENGLVALRYDGTKAMAIPGGEILFKFLHNGDSSSHYLVMRAGDSANPSNFQTILFSGGLATSQVGYALRYGDASGQNDNLTISATRGVSGTNTYISAVNDVFTPNQQSIVFINIDGDNPTASLRALGRINADAQNGNNTSTLLASTANSSNAFGISSFNTQRLQGSIQELIVYDTDQSANETVLRNNANSYFSIF